MTWPRFGLPAALLLSLLAHLLPFAGALIQPEAPPRQATPPLQALLKRPAQAPAAPPLTLDRPQASSGPATAPPRPTEKPATTGQSAPKQRPENWQAAIRRQFAKQHEQGEFYPQEAIARGEQGEVQVLVMIDEQGQVAAARVEQGSGFPLLDQAALQAVRKLHSLPAETPRELVLPVRFRLH